MSIYQNVFFRGMDRLRGRRTISRLEFLRASQYWERERLIRWQLDRLNDLIEKARRHSRFHAGRLAGVDRFEELSDIEQIPVLTKAEVRANRDLIKADNVPESRFISTATGGSTGEPLEFFWDKRGRDWNRASVYRSAAWAGAPLGTKAIQVSSAYRTLTARQQVTRKATHYLQRYRSLDLAVVSDEVLDTCLGKICSYQPVSIWASPSSLELLAARADTHHRDIDWGFLRAVIPSGETLRPDQRELIDRVCGVGKVFDHYGSSEFYVGAECPAHDGLHLHSEVLLIEVVDKDNHAVGAGKTGRILVTDLTNEAFPFIRYEIGDLGVLTDGSYCECGVRLPRLQSVAGRISDMVVLEDRVLPALSFTNYFLKVGIDAFQVRQQSGHPLKIIVVPGEGFTEQTLARVMHGLGDLVGEATRLELVRSDSIEVPPSGKRRFVISDAGRDYY